MLPFSPAHFLLCYRRRVGQFHDIKEIAFAAADVEERKLAGMFAGEAFEALDAFELALEWPVIVEGVTPNDLESAQSTRGAAREPDFAIRTTAYAPKQFVVRDGGRLGARN